MSKGDRANKVVAEEYTEGFYSIRRYPNGMWKVIDGCVDLEREFETLPMARAWCREHPADPETEGKYLA